MLARWMLPRVGGGGFVRVDGCTAQEGPALVQTAETLHALQLACFLGHVTIALEDQDGRNVSRRDLAFEAQRMEDRSAPAA